MTDRAILIALACLGFTSFGSAAENVPAAKQYEVQTLKDLAYHEGDDADPIKHKLDLYVPKDAKDYPTVVFVHGGAWVFGDKSQLGIYSSIGKSLARQGIAAAVVNYRLSPKVQHPEHVKDVARAFAWTHQNIAKHGGNAEKLFVCGHSAGGHLTALLASDETYLKAHNLSLKCIKGAVPMSGVYLIGEGFLPQVFGKDAEKAKLASPLAHVKADLPPFLIIHADKDMPLCDKMSATFCNALKDKQCTAELCEVKDRNHMSIIMSFSKESDPAMQALVSFVRKQSEK
jgi:acetyl esterase/lipase